MYRMIAGVLAGLCLVATPALTQPSASPPPQPLRYVWKNADMRGGGFVPGLVFHPTEQGLLYARTDIGGAYRYDPAQNRWIPLLDHLGRDDAALMGVLSIGLDPKNPDLVYLAGGLYTHESEYNRKAALLISADRGTTWKKTELPFYLGGNEDGRSTGERLIVDPNLSTTLYLGTSKNGLWQSLDSGLTWQKTALPAKHILFVLADEKSPTLYAGVEDRNGQSLYVSTDAGQNWQPVAGAPKNLMPHHAERDATGKLFLTFGNNLGPNGVTDGAVKTYDPATGKWDDITPLKPAGETFGYAGLTLDRNNPGTLLVSTLNRWGSGDEIFRSTDNGKSWKPLSKASHFNTSDAPWLVPFSGGRHDRLGHWIADIEIDPFNPDRSFYVTGYGLWESRTLIHFDKGDKLEWLFTNQGLEETAPLELISPPKGAHLLSALGDIGGFRHDDLFDVKGATYFDPNGGSNRSIDFAEDKPEIIVRTSDKRPYGYISTDGGTNWRGFASHPETINDPQNHGTETMGIAINADASRIMWIPKNSVPYVSSDYGQTWVKSTGAPLNSESHIYPVSDRVNPLKFYLYDNRKKTVYYSEDAGTSFRTGSTSIIEWGSRMRAAPNNEGHLWLGGWNGLNVSDDGGKTFSNVPGFETVWAVTFGAGDPKENYPALFVWGKLNGREGIYMSPDIGARWVRLTNDKQQFGALYSFVGDPRIFGRLYLGVGGRGIMVGDFVRPSTDSTPPSPQ